MMVAVRIRMKKRKGGPMAVICKKKTSKSEDVVVAKSYVVVRICPFAKILQAKEFSCSLTVFSDV